VITPVLLDRMAAAAWTAYSEAVGGKSVNGDDLPTWEQLKKNTEGRSPIVDGWRAVAKAAYDQAQAESHTPPTTAGIHIQCKAQMGPSKPGTRTGRLPIPNGNLHLTLPGKLQAVCGFNPDTCGSFATSFKLHSQEIRITNRRLCAICTPFYWENREQFSDADRDMLDKLMYIDKKPKPDPPKPRYFRADCEKAVEVENDK